MTTDTEKLKRQITIKMRRPFLNGLHDYVTFNAPNCVFKCLVIGFDMYRNQVFDVTIFQTRNCIVSAIRDAEYLFEARSYKMSVFPKRSQTALRLEREGSKI